MVGVLHRVLGWSLASIFEEYRIFSSPKERFVDQQFIECWEMTLPTNHPLHPNRSVQQRRNSNSNDAAEYANESKWVDSNNTAGIVDDKAAHLLNPEANDQLLKKEAKNAAAAAAAARIVALGEPPATTTHASLHQPHSDRTLMHSNASGGSATLARSFAHHQHTQSQPNLAAFANTR